MQSYIRDGYLIVRSLFTPEETQELRTAFTDLAHQSRPKGLFDDSRLLGPDDPLAKYPRCMHPHRWKQLPIGRLATRYMLDPRVGAIIRDLFGEEPLAAQSMFYYKPAGARGQDLHQDNFYLRVKPGTCMAAWLAVDDADRENGGMVLVPGSHMTDIVCPKASDKSIFFTTEHVDVPAGLQEVPADLKSGDCLFFNGSVIHGSYPNTSRDRFRRAFICHYVPRSSEEVAQHYRPLQTFDGNVLDGIASASGGGSCGNVQAATAPH